MRLEEQIPSVTVQREIAWPWMLTIAFSLLGSFVKHMARYGKLTYSPKVTVPPADPRQHAALHKYTWK